MHASLVVIQPDYVPQILKTLACVVPFLSAKTLNTLPAKIASSIVNIPYHYHSAAINLISGYLLPLLLGALPFTDADNEKTMVGLSAPSILHSIFQACGDRSLDLQIVETFMAYRRNVCGDLLYVMAYGTPSVLEPAIHMLNRYYPSVEIGTVAEYRSAPQQDKITFQRCESIHCAKNTRDGFINTADFVCLDPRICSEELIGPPPLYLCAACRNLLDKDNSALFVDVIRSIGNIAEQCENPDCYSERRAGMHFCFSTECTSRNRRKPMRLCNDCNDCLHGKESKWENHIVHSCLFDLWSMKTPTQTYLVDTIARLLSEAHPPYRERCVEMGLDMDSLTSIDLPKDTKDTNFYKKITRSLHGLGMLKSLSPIPPSSYSYEHMSQLLSMLFAWLEAVSCTTHMNLMIVEIVQRYQKQAISWIEKVRNYDFELYCDCLFPLPPIQARVGLPWQSLMSNNRRQLEGLQRLSVLVGNGLVQEGVWERVLPLWMQELKETVGSEELPIFKTVLSRIFDVKSDEAPSYSLNFIKRRLLNVNISQRQEGLVWLQMLSAVNISLNVSDLITIFLKSASQAELSDDDEDSSGGTMFTFPDPQSYRDPPMSPGYTSPAPTQSPLISDKLSSVKSSRTHCILLMDVLIKQLSLAKQTTNMSIDDQEVFNLTRLLVMIVDHRKEDNHENHTTQTSCQSCQITGIFYSQITFLLHYILPSEMDIETRTLKAYSRTGSQKSSVRSRDSTINNTNDQKKLQRTYSIHSNSEFDETALSCDADVSSLGVEEQDSSVIDGAKSEGSESESENLFAWRDRIRGISDATNMSTQNSIKETSSWADIYDSNPDIELTVLLLQHIFKHTDPVVLCNILKSITMLCVRGECLRVSAREDLDLTHYLQTVLFIPSLWEMLQSSNSYLAQMAVPLLLHCICMPYGAGRLCDEIEDVFNNEDWKKRFSAVEKVTLLCQFLSKDLVRDSSLAKSALVHGFVYLVSAIDDVHNAVSSRARTMLLSINEKSLKLLYFYMDGHFQRESADRLMLLHALRSLNAVLASTSPFSAKCFLKLFSHLTTKSKASTSNSNYSGWASSTPSDHDLHLQSPHIPLWSRALSSPARGTGISNWASVSVSSSKRPRSASAPLVMYKQKYTLQFERQSSHSSTVKDEDVTDSRPGSLRQRRMWTPSNDPFNKGTSSDTSLLDGVIEAECEELDEGDENSIKQAMPSLSSPTLSSKSVIFNDKDNIVLHYLVTVMMEYLSDDKAVSEEVCLKDEIGDLVGILKSFMVALTNDCEGEDLSMRPDDLRQCTVFLAYIFNLTTVLDCNPFVGKECLPFTLQLMLQCVKDETNRTEICDLNLDRLEPALQHVWLMNLLVILYKYPFNELKSSILPLIQIVVNSVNAHQHHLCISQSQSDVTSLDGTNRFLSKKTRKKERAAGTRRARGRADKYARGFDDFDAKDLNDDAFEMSSLRFDSRCSDAGFSDVETTTLYSPSTPIDRYQLGRVDSVSSTNEENIILNKVFSSRKCEDCGCTLSEYQKDIVNLCIVVLSTFVHRDPEMAAPQLMHILCVVSRKCQSQSPFLDYPSDGFHSSVRVPGATMGIAKQFIRCVFVQLSPNGLFAELFRCEILDEQFFTTVISSLAGFDVLDEIAPLTNALRDFSSRSNRSDRLIVFLQNLQIYLECVPKDKISLWEDLLHDLESFFKNVQAVLPSGLELSSLLRIMTVILGISKHFAKNLLPSMGNIVTHIVRKCDFQLEDLYDVCHACTGAFSKERERLFLIRIIHQELGLVIKDKYSIHERNVKRIIHLILLHSESWFSFEPGDIDIKHKIGSKKDKIKMMDCVQMYQNDLVDFIKNWNYRLKDMRDIDEESFDQHYFPIQLKASLAQILAFHWSLSLRDEKMVKISASRSQSLNWLKGTPSQIWRVDQILESVTNLQFLSWLLLGAVNNAVDYPESHEVIHVISLAENLRLVEYIKNVLTSIAQQDTEKSLRSLRPALYITFITCQLWTVYCECHMVFQTESESEPLATIMEFWSQLTLHIVKQLGKSQKVKLDLLLPFIKIMKGISNCSGYAFTRLSALWFPLVRYFKEELPGEVYRSFKTLEEFSERAEDPKPDLHDLVNSVRLRLARLERAGNKFDHASVV